MNKFHSPLHRATFRRFFLKSLTLAIPQFLITAILFFTNNVDSLYGNFDQETGAPIKASDLYRFVIVNDIFRPEIMAPLLAGLGVIFGVALFFFIDSKRTMTVYYSIGITRKQLFTSVYAAGAAALSLTVILPFIATAVANVAFIGNSAIIWTQTLYFILFVVGMNLFGFSVAAYCMAGTGTVFEGAFNSIAFTALPFFFGNFLNILSKRFLNGSAFNLVLKPMIYETPQKDPVYGNVGVIAPEWNPFKFGDLLFSSNESYGCSFKDDKVVNSLWDNPGAVFVAIAVLALAALIGTFAVRKFSKRKSEFCGMPAADKFMNLCSITVVGYFIVCTLSAKIPVNYILAAVIALAVFAVLFFIVSCLTEHSFKLGFTHWKQCLVSVGALGALVVILITGGFGYSSYIPDVDEIKSARVTSVHEGFRNSQGAEVLPGLRRAASQNISFGMGSDGTTGREYVFDCPLYTGYFDESEASKVTALHQKLIASDGYTVPFAGFNASMEGKAVSRDVAICYTLKNGKTVMRYFRNVNDEALDAAVLVQQNKFYKSEMIENFKKLLNEENKLAVEAPFHDEYKELELTSEQKTELLKAVEKDLTAQTAEERFFPDKQICGYISTLSIEETMKAMGSRNNPNYETVSEEAASSVLTVTTDMVNTVTLLQKLGYADVFNHRPEIDEIYITSEYNIFTREQYLPIVECSYNAYHGFQDDKITNPYESGVNDKSKVLSVTDKKQIDEILSVAQPIYPTTRGGYQISMRIGNENLISALIPEDKAPEWVKTIKIK